MEHLVRFLPSERSIRILRGTTLLEATRRAGLPLASGCSANGMCGRCGLQILAGEQHVADESPREREIKRANRIDPGLRLACSITPTGDLVVTAPYW
ncbi:MAG: 2Fe-2S iron-sulfur cluster-binding protein [Myxococcota bacterium]